MSTMTPSETVNKPTLPPGPRPLPLLGNVLDFRRDQLGYLEHLQRTYGDMVTMYIGNAPVLILFAPEYVRYVLTENPRNFTNREAAQGLLELIGDGLLTTDGEVHRRDRRLVQPAFHRKRVESYADIMVQYTQRLLQTWQPGQQLDIAVQMQTLTMRIVAKCLFNVDLAHDASELGEAFTAMLNNPATLAEGFLGLRFDVPFTAYGRRMAAKRKVDDFIYRLLAQRRGAQEDVGDVLSMLLVTEDDQPVFTDVQIRDHIMTLFAAGHETTANALTWTFYLLSQNPEKQAKLLHELDTVLAGRAPTVADIPQLPYTGWVLDEAMRLYPPAWLQGRRATEAFDLGGYHFPAGTMLLFSQWVLQRTPEIWEQAIEFLPERWEPENGQKVPAWSYFPFGGGPRMCIGMPFAQLEAKLLLATILQSYTTRLATGYKLEMSPLITLRPKHGMPMLLAKR